MTLNVRHNFEMFFLFINESTNYFKNIFLQIKMPAILLQHFVLHIWNIFEHVLRTFIL